jgi:hypothetical protein
MADEREISEMTRAPDRARSIAGFLLKLGDVDWTDWELDFLDSMSEQRSELTRRQAEKIIELRDDAVVHTVVGGIDLQRLLDQCWIARLDLADDVDVEFVERLKRSGQAALRRPEALRLRRCAIELQLIDAHPGWGFSTLRNAA